MCWLQVKGKDDLVGKGGGGANTWTIVLGAQKFGSGVWF